MQRDCRSSTWKNWYLSESPKSAKLREGLAAKTVTSVTNYLFSFKFEFL